MMLCFVSEYSLSKYIEHYLKYIVLRLTYFVQQHVSSNIKKNVISLFLMEL